MTGKIVHGEMIVSAFVRGIMIVGVRTGILVGVFQPGTEVVLDPVIGTCVEMTAGTGLHTIATHLPIPEQGFTQFYRFLFILYKMIQIRRFGDRNVLQ